MLRVVVIFALVAAASSSAIPMWEYLTKNEKVMYLFNMFQSQVQDRCATDACKQDLKNFGWDKLKSMDEDDLDQMDPFQRGSNDLIWESVMEGHSAPSDTLKRSTTTTPKPNSYEDDTIDQDASARIETVQRLPPPEGFEGYGSRRRPSLVIGSDDAEFRRPGTGYPTSNAIQEPTRRPYGHDDYRRVPLTGPWVVKVYPDGTPVDTTHVALPEDDDLKFYQMTRGILQNL